LNARQRQSDRRDANPKRQVAIDLLSRQGDDNGLQTRGNDAQTSGECDRNGSIAPKNLAPRHLLAYLGDLRQGFAKFHGNGFPEATRETTL
jgi:hypothetical protein